MNYFYLGLQNFYKRQVRFLTYVKARFILCVMIPRMKINQRSQFLIHTSFFPSLILVLKYGALIESPSIGGELCSWFFFMQNFYDAFFCSVLSTKQFVNSERDIALADSSLVGNGVSFFVSLFVSRYT